MRRLRVLSCLQPLPNAVGRIRRLRRIRQQCQLPDATLARLIRPTNCSDAIAYYQRTLGAELLYKISFGEMPKSAQDSAENCPSGMQFPDTAIAHANVRIAGSDIMMSDAMPSGKASYSGFTLVLDSQQVEEGKRWFDNLAANGKIEMAWQETFWAHGFGKVTDKFGVPWMINVVKQQPTQ